MGENLHFYVLLGDGDAADQISFGGALTQARSALPTTHMHIQESLNSMPAAGFVSTRPFLLLPLFRHIKAWWPTLPVSAHTLSSAYKPSLPSLEYFNSAFKFNSVLTPLEQHACAPSQHRAHALYCLEPADRCYCHICHTYFLHICLPFYLESSWCTCTWQRTWRILETRQCFRKH